MTLPDASVWIDHFNGIDCWQTERLDRLLKTEPVAMGDLIFAETLQGFREESSFQKARDRLSSLPFFTLGGYDRALATARNFRLLRRQGITIRKTIDVFIATLSRLRL